VLSIDTDLDDLVRGNSLYFAFFTAFDSFAQLLANYVTVVEERPIMSAIGGVSYGARGGG